MINVPHEIMISYFDMHVGPSLLFQNIGNQDSKEITDFNLPKQDFLQLMDIHEPGDFFIHYFNQIISVNYIFSIGDPGVRGGEHLLMTSMLFPKNDSTITEEKYLSAIFSNIPNYKTDLQQISSMINKNSLIKMLLKSNKGFEFRKNPYYGEIKAELTHSLARKIRIN